VLIIFILPVFFLVTCEARTLVESQDGKIRIRDWKINY
jgi:hypothetical protein